MAASLLFGGADLTADGVLASQAADIQPLRTFKDWVIGCDNIRRCTTLGTMADGGSAGHIIVRREGAPNAPVSVTVKLWPEAMPQAPASIAILVDGKPAALSTSSWPIEEEGSPFAVASLSPQDSLDLARSIKSAKSLTLQLISGGRVLQEVPVSLAGSAAALLYMDDRQKRVGTTTALASTGNAPASSIPIPPQPPALNAVAMSSVDEPGELPAGIEPADESCQGIDPIVIRLSSSQMLWGICETAAAYNFAYRFWIASADLGKNEKPRPVTFLRPGIDGNRTADGDDASVLINPGVSSDGKSLSAFSKGRGLGDCGEIGDWAFDGQGFRLLSYVAMDSCSGVMPDDWPVLFTATPS